MRRIKLTNRDERFIVAAQEDGYSLDEAVLNLFPDLWATDWHIDGLDIVVCDSRQFVAHCCDFSATVRADSSERAYDIARECYGNIQQLVEQRA